MNAQLTGSPLELSPDNPWPGLQSFDEASQAFFFGLHAETDALFRLVRRATLTLFYGRSGLGKTSLLQAGLFPRLREANLLPVPIRLDYGPKAPPLLSQVKQAVANALSEAGIDVRSPAEGESLWEYFHHSDVDFWDAQNRLVTLVLVFDQFEERFTLGRQLADTDAQAEVCLAELSQLVENRPPPLLKTKFEAQADGVGSYDFNKRSCKVILSLREDFLPELENLRDRFPSILENTLRLQAMNEAQAMDVVLGPGSQLVSEQVAAEIVRFVGRADQWSQVCCTVEPVLLSVVLYGLNQRRRQNQQPTITSDLLLGSREQILDDFYEEALEGLPARARLLVEDGLLTNSGRRDTLAWEDALAEFGVDEQEVLTLIDRHLLRREDRSDGARIELVHDRVADVVRRHRDCRREQERYARELADLQAHQARLEREKEIHRRRSRRLLVACVALALFAALVSGYSIWDRYLHSWQHETYFSNITQRNGIFEGVGPLTKEQVSRRKASFRFVRRGACGPLLRVQAVDSKGRLTHRHSADTYMEFRYAENVFKYLEINDNPARECQWEFVQDAARRIAYELAYDKNAHLVWGFAYSPSSSNDLQKIAHFVGPDGLPNSQTASEAEYVRIEYWPNGLEKQFSYFDRTGHPRIGRDGAYAIYMDYDALGLRKRVVAMDVHGRPIANKEGVAITEFTHDAQGNSTEILAFDAAGKRALHKEGWSRAILTYDDYGNEVEEAYFDTSGKPCLNKYGVAKMTLKYDERGNSIEAVFFDASGKPCLNKNGCAKAAFKYDERGNRIEDACFDTNGKPCLNKVGVARETHKYDERGNLIEAACFDTNGKPCLSPDGFTKFAAKYDDRSNWIAFEYYGLDGQRCLTSDGYAKITAEYNERGNLVRVACFGLRDEPAIFRSSGIHAVKKSYDERGNCIAWEYYGADGQRCLAKDGYAKMTANYDERGNQVKVTCFGLRDEPAIDQSNGAHAVEQSYDERGNCIAWEYYGADGQRCLTKDGYAKMTANYDDRGRRLEQVEFDLTGKSTVKKYGRGGEEIEEAYFDETGNPTANQNGVARLTAKYSEGANPPDKTYFDRDGKPIAVEIYVDKVLPDGQAKEAGLMEGDVLVSYDGKAVRNDAEIRAWVKTPGDTPRELVVSRSGRRISFKMKPGLMGISMVARAAPAPVEIGSNALDR
jgi:PDZ domain